MKAGWQTKMLVDTCVVFADGDWIESKDQSSEGIRLIQTGNVGEGIFKSRGDKARYITEETFKRLRCTEIFEGDCLISRLPDPAGRSCLLPDTGERMITAVDCTIVRFDRKLVVPMFFNYFSQSQNYLSAVDSETTGTTRKRISRNKLAQIPFPLPQLLEQQRIVGILDEAFDSIANAKANAEKNLQNARALFESHLQSVFSHHCEEWAENKKPLADLCELIVDCEHKTAPKQEEGIPSIRTPNIGKGKLLLDGVYRVSEETYREWTRRAEPLPGDLILAREAPAGNVAVIPKNLKVCLGQRTVLIRPSRNVFEPEFLALMLLQPRMQEKLLAHSRGATVQHVNMKDIRALKVGCIPPLSVQRDIVSVVGKASQETQRLESIYKQKLAALDELKKSLLHQAFSGAL